MIAEQGTTARRIHLECSSCHKESTASQINTFAKCEQCNGQPFVACYDLEGGAREQIESEERSMWRYFHWLPVSERRNIVSLGEGFTPLFQLKNIGEQLNMPNLLIKDESLNPTGSFKARGMSMAISKANELGVEQCIVPTAGNAGGAMAAYCAKAKLKAVVVMPAHTPKVFKQECEMFGAELILVDGLISDCGKRVREMNANGAFFDMSTMKEPYRLEGKKTMGYEIAEQMEWRLPDVILYPTGGGTGLIGMWKAFDEMIRMGWLTNKRPRMIAVQAENCKPVMETWLGTQENCKSYRGSPTIASGLAVPNPFCRTDDTQRARRIERISRSCC
jgi:threonine synthase